MGRTRDRIACDGLRNGHPCSGEGKWPFQMKISKDRVAREERHPLRGLTPAIYAFEIRHTALLCNWCLEQARLMQGANAQILP